MAPKKNVTSTENLISPVYDRVIIRQSSAAAMTSGGIHIPDNVQEKPTEGEVLAVGPGAFDFQGRRVPMSTKKGDLVLFNKFAGQPIRIQGEDLIIIKDGDVLGIVVKGATAEPVRPIKALKSARAS